MFQYAASKALAMRRGADLCLDVTSFEGYTLHHGFELKRIFDCPENLASNSDIRKVLGWRAAPLVRRVLSLAGMRLLRGRSLAMEPSFSYWPAYEDAPGECYLFGYWQSERYFADVAASIRKDFEFKTQLNSKNDSLARQIRNVNAVSLHVRRGDYVKNPVTLAKHGVCSPEYYRDAIARITEEVDAPFFFIFSDDIQWVKENVGIEYPCKYIDHNSGADSFNDMRLMSMCRHHIIANSSFSWWGAWLAQSPRQIVIAPEPWFDDLSIDTRDLLPDRWIKIHKHCRVASGFLELNRSHCNLPRTEHRTSDNAPTQSTSGGLHI
jgi:Glycosyl transferase family 11